jgi:hypothetical protein
MPTVLHMCSWILSKKCIFMRWTFFFGNRADLKHETPVDCEERLEDFRQNVQAHRQFHLLSHCCEPGVSIRFSLFCVIFIFLVTMILVLDLNREKLSTNNSRQHFQHVL